jgi:hypothetical protein
VGTTLNTNMQQCRTLYPYWGDIETASGQDIAAIVAKCQLKPLRKADYTPYGVTFTDAQWERLKTAFPHGVCDFSKPSIGQVPSEPWISYGAGRGEGRTLGPAPTSSRRL